MNYAQGFLLTFLKAYKNDNLELFKPFNENSPLIVVGLFKTNSYLCVVTMLKKVRAKILLSNSV